MVISFLTDAIKVSDSVDAKLGTLVVDTCVFYAVELKGSL